MKKLHLRALLYLVAEHTYYLVAHGFFACRAEMDVDLVCGLSDALHKVGLFGFRGFGSGFICNHNHFPFRAVNALRTHKTPFMG
jgi:hypothetical protein